MGIFKDFEDDLSQAVTELGDMDGDTKKKGKAASAEEEDQETMDILSALDAIDELPGDALHGDKEEDTEEEETPEEEKAADSDTEEEMPDDSQPESDTAKNETEEDDTEDDSVEEPEIVEETSKEEKEMSKVETTNVDVDVLGGLLDENMEDVDITPMNPDEDVLSEERTNGNVTVITKGTIINGGISSDGSLEVMGTIEGDVECLGKLSIIGKVGGNAIATEIFVNTSRLEGNLSSEGTVKIGGGSIVVGSIIASSAVIAGAVKGDIDVNGPVIVDSTAIVQGNIKAKSIQINNGAVVDGFCSLNYAGIDLDAFFAGEGKKVANKKGD